MDSAQDSKTPNPCRVTIPRRLRINASWAMRNKRSSSKRGVKKTTVILTLTTFPSSFRPPPDLKSRRPSAANTAPSEIFRSSTRPVRPMKTLPFLNIKLIVFYFISDGSSGQRPRQVHYSRQLRDDHYIVRPSVHFYDDHLEPVPTETGYSIASKVTH